MGALRTCVLLCASSKQFQNKNVFIKTVSVASSNLGYILHHCTWDSGECSEKSIQHQNQNSK